MDLAEACSDAAMEAAAAASCDDQRDAAPSTSSNGSGDSGYTAYIARLYAELSRKVDAATAHTLHVSGCPDVDSQLAVASTCQTFRLKES